MSLADLRGHRVVLVFYPCAFEPVSSGQLILYQDYLPEFEALDAHLIGISADGLWCHRAFARHVGIHFPLLSDMPPHGAVSRRYGVFGELSEMTRRALVVIDRAGVIRFSQLYSDLLNPGVGDPLWVLEHMGGDQSGGSALGPDRW